MPNHEIDVLLLQIRTAVLELRRLEGDGLDGSSSRRGDRSSKASSPPPPSSLPMTEPRRRLR